MIKCGGGEESRLVEREELNVDIGDGNLEKREIKSKFEWVKGGLNKCCDYWWIERIDKEEEVREIESCGCV